MIHCCRDKIEVYVLWLAVTTFHNFIKRNFLFFFATVIMPRYYFCQVVMFLVVFVCLFVCLHDYLQSNEQICMTLLPEVYLEPRTNPLDF